MNNIPQNEPDRQNYYRNELSGFIQKQEQLLNRKLTCHIATFGCQMNARDSEKLLGILKAAGFQETEEETAADLVVMNTCTVRDNANKRIYGRLGVLKSFRKSNPHMRIAMCGCMMQEPSVIEKIKKSYPYVDLIFGTHNIYKLAELLFTMYSEDRQVIEILKQADRIVEDLPVERKYPFKSGVNIMFGCDNFCSYCIVPYVRGRERSRKSEEILCEIRKLADSGVREIMLLGQNVNSYGKGLDEKIDFAGLLKETAKIDGIERIRFMTSHPKDLSDDLITVMEENEKVCLHLHLPLQSGSSRILKLMNRKYDKEQYLALAEKIRSRMPSIAITTDIIVGFPTETKEDVDETLDVIRKVRFDNAFTFIYSKRTGTPAANMEQVDEAFVKEQFDRVLQLVQETSKEMTGRFVGETVKVLAEEVNEQDPSLLTGRMEQNFVVHFPGDPSMIGQILSVKLLSCKGFYYIGEPV
ncbi:MAG: tRNA (N6-isopentenyl adenosine(37)-C2)-methylthiotransferase MiaB [Lachnospiraceae bacterium]|nr:tRNA (N6-isopentenyl adenosine(37)-C2)-methylthiotransferase MiaB [Lachnospiraceae bacterium]